MTQALVTPISAARVPALRMFTALLRAELTRLLRNRAFLIPSLLLPIMFFALFALPNIQGHLSGIGAGPYMLVSYAAYDTNMYGPARCRPGAPGCWAARTGQRT